MTRDLTDFDTFMSEAMCLIASRKKMTSPLYQVILSGQASRELLRDFVIHRYPIKNHWTRNILGIASRIDDYCLRIALVENIYEEETGALTNSSRHLDTFVAFGRGLGLSEAQIRNGPVIPETAAMIEHNIRVCNSAEVHFTCGVLSVLMLMEGQPPIVSGSGTSMESVMRDVYQLPLEAYEFFTHHASSDQAGDAVSELEDEHAQAARNILQLYCDTPELREQALAALERAIDLRHAHFDAIYRPYQNASLDPFRWTRDSVGA